MKRSFLLCSMIAAMVTPSHGVMALEQHEIPPGMTAEVSEQGVCRKVTNNGAAKIMVPVRSAQEWAVGGGAFLNNLRDMDGVGIEKCDGYQDDYCFLWASGIGPSNLYNLVGSRSTIGSNSETWWAERDGNIPNTNLVGVGRYPDSYGTFESPGPIRGASYTSLDGIAVGADATVLLYPEKNFGGTPLRVEGPTTIVNRNFGDSLYNLEPDDPSTLSAQDTWAYMWKSDDWSGDGPLIAQFTPSTRKFTDEVGLSGDHPLRNYEYGSIIVTCK